MRVGDYCDYPANLMLRWWEPLIGPVGCYNAAGAKNAYTYCVLPYGDRSPKYLSSMMEWISENPKSIGWYATLHSWDSDEGTFPGTHYWNGKEWHDANPPFGVKSSDPVMSHLSEVFENPKQAKELAYRNDPEQ